MAEVNRKDRVVKVKIVYYGPPLGGKTTNLQVLHRHALAGRRGEMISVNSMQDRTILFDLLPLKTLGLLGLDLRLQLLAVPGQAAYAITRRVALRGADGIVFVANSAADRSKENLDSLREMMGHLVAHQIDPATIPLVFQYNKRDLPLVSTVEELESQLNHRKERALAAVAPRGEGVIETLSEILIRTFRDLTRRFRALEMPRELTIEEWCHQALLGIFGRERLLNAPAAEVQPKTLKRIEQSEFGIPSEFELELEPDPAPGADTTPPPSEVCTIRVPTRQAVTGRAIETANPAAVAESYAEACAQLALDLTEARSERDLSRSHLAEIREAVDAARRLSPTDAKAQLQKIIACLGGDAAPEQVTLALWEGAQRAEQELRRQREALLQSEKLAAMGTLLAGVAHELNNPLSVITGQAELLRHAAGEGPVGLRADRIGQAAQRCARIVRNFLALARQQPAENRQVALNQIIQEATELVVYPLRVDGVALVLDLASGLPQLWADPHQIHQVVINLLTNAHQALRQAPAPRRIAVKTRADGERRRVVLEVADTGPGIPPEIAARIFEPFFTTKAPGEGTGLGLSLCHGIVESHGGSLRVDSQPGHGATFIVELPIPARISAIKEDRKSEAVPLARKHILVVDDEPDVAGTLVELLNSDGHRVETAPNGQVALDKLQGKAYDLIVSDVRMPILDGPGLYRQVERLHPQLRGRFIFVTGDMVNPESRGFLDRLGAISLAKPFALEDVRRAIAQVGQRSAPAPAPLVSQPS